MVERYSAFISYSHGDEATARWLHRAIENYRFPKALIGEPCEFGPVPRKLPPVFRDRDELAASGDLGQELRSALASSRFQIVLCSPSSARSKWVEEEIRAFKQTHGEGRTLALILSGEPYAGGDEECFPRALRYKLGAKGAVSEDPAEPIAADMRAGKDGRRLALLKLLAGISGLRLDALVRRDAARKQRRLAFVSAASTLVAVVTIGLAIYAESQRRVAVQQRELAENSLDFLIGTFEIANPATENPRTITALTILDRASRRAAAEFEARPAVAARLLRATGDIYYNLGLQQESQRDLAAALRLEPKKGAGRAETLLKLATLARSRGDADALRKLVGDAAQAYRPGDQDADELNAKVAEQRAQIAYLEADYPLAARLFSRAAQDYEDLDGDYRDKIAESLMNEAYSLVQAQQFGDVDRLYARAAALTVARFGMKDVHTARAFHNRAFANLSAGRPDRAASEMERALAIYNRVLEGNHPNLAAAELLLGRIYAAKGEFRKAAASFARARAIFVSLYGEGNPAVGDVDFYTAEVEAGAGRIEEALKRANTVKGVYDANYGPDDPDQAELLLLRSRIYEHAKNRQLALLNCEKALELQKKLKMDGNVIEETNLSCAKIASRK